MELEPAGERAVTVTPWPFSDPRVAVRTEGRRLRGPFESEEEMRAALAEAPWTELEFELRPGAGQGSTP